VRPRRVVVVPPPLDQHPRLQQRREDLSFEQLVTQLPVEALDVPVLPGRARLDVQRLYADLPEPSTHRLGRKLRTIVRSDMSGHAPGRHQPCQPFQDVIAPELSADIDRQALACVLIDHGEHPKGTPFTRPSLHEVVAPHVVTMLGPQPYAAPVVEPQTPAFGLLRRHFQPLPPPDPLDPLVIDMPAIPPQQSGDTAIAVPPVHTCKLDDPLGQRQFIIPYHGQVPLRRTRLLQDFARPPLGDAEAIQQSTDRLTPPVRA